MKPKLLVTLCLLAGLASLPGCLAINATLGVLGLVGPPAVQLAGVAYTVTEYTYEYAAHDRTPDQVMLAKFDWLIGPDEEGAPDRKPFREVALASPRTPIPARQGAERPDLEPLFELAAHPILPAGFSVVPARPEAVAALPLIRVQAEPVAAQPPVVVATAAATAEPEPPAHTYVHRITDPLLVRLNRMESGFPQAEALLLAQGGGLRLSMPCPDGEPCSLGVSGSWSIRHPVMQPIAQPVVQPVQSTDSVPRSLNT